MARASNKSSAIARVEKRIVPVADAEPYVKILVYGRNGQGKTRFAASGGKKTLIVDVNEKGTRSVRHYPNASVFHVKQWTDLTYVYWYLREGSHDYETVVIDTLTQAQQMCMRHVLNEAEDRDPNRPPSMPDRRAWGQMGELMKPIILNYRNLPMNVVLVCQERVDSGGDDEEDTGVVRVPDLSPSVRGIAMGAVEIMGRVYRREVKVGKGKRERKAWETRMLVGPHDSYETKDRTGMLGHIVRNPTMDMMIEASLGGGDE